MSQPPAAATRPERRGALDWIEWAGNKLPDPVRAGLLSLRLPTEHELAGFAARTRPWRAALPM